MESGKAKQMADLKYGAHRASGSSMDSRFGKGQENTAKHDCEGKSNRRIAVWLSAQQCRIDSFQTVTGEC